MADSRISQLTPITGANLQANDLFVVARPTTSQNFSMRRDELVNAVASQPYASRTAFIATTVPDDADRTAFFVSGNTYAIVRDASGPIVQANGQTWKPDGDVTPQHFGAVGDGVTDDGAALVALAAFASTTDTQIVFDGFYRSTVPVVFNSNALSLVFTVPNVSGLLFDGCAGITINQTTRYAGLSIKGGVLATNAVGLYTGLTYINTLAATGDAGRKLIDGTTFIGLDRLKQMGGNVHGWLDNINLSNADRLMLNDIYIQGAEQDRLNEFPRPTRGVIAANSTQLVFKNPIIFITETALEVTGQSEGVEVQGGTIVANRKGINFNPTIAPANDTNIVGVHIASMDYNIKLNGSFSTTMHNVSGCLLFTRTEAYVSSTFRHVIADGPTQISDNFFFTAAGIDPALHVGVDLIAPVSGTHVGSLVVGNRFEKVPTITKIAVGVNNSAIAGNMTRDDGVTVLAAPVVDAGVGTTVGFNFGDRDFGEAKSDTGVFWSPTVSPGLYTGANKNKVFTASQAAATTVNHLDALSVAAGSGVTLRALGADAAIDLILQPKAARPVRPASDNATDLGSTTFRWNSSYAREMRPGAGATIWTSGAGTPEGSVTAVVGSLYTRTDGGAGTTLYVKESGVGNTGWVAK
jgi:hypothetical protein